MDMKSLQHSFADMLRFTLGKDRFTVTELDSYQATSMAIRDRLLQRWLSTQQHCHFQDVKRVYYLSMEYLMGRALGNALINLGIYDNSTQALFEMGLELEEIRELEWDAGLGNGGLGRLAACFLDSMATQKIPCFGYGIRYDYGIFHQHIVDGWQAETPDNWLRYGNPWEIERPEYIFTVRFYGHVNRHVDETGRLRNNWEGTQNVMAMAYDTPIPGYNNDFVNTLRLWSAKSTREFNFQVFNQGDYMSSVQERTKSETISKVLYPNDNTMQGKELRLKQEYFFVSATLQDILRRYTDNHDTFDALPDKAAIQLNDTHPALAIVELMYLLMDMEGLPWDKAWDITTRVCSYTNHTILPEALERWSVSLMERLLPRHLQIIYEINRRFLDTVWTHCPGDTGRLREMSIIAEEPDKSVQMAKLAIVGTHKVNGVSELHSQILKDTIFKPFYELMPERFTNKTNGITQRRWLKLANPRLTSLLSSCIGDEWVTDLAKLHKLEEHIEDENLRQHWRQVKRLNKQDFAGFARKNWNMHPDPDSMFDFQVKRMHEYKRQLLNVLRVIHEYNCLRDNPSSAIVPRSVFFGGKAAPGYHTAKLVIKLISSVGHVVNNDPHSRDMLRMYFLPNYNVSMAQRIFPAADLSEQISTAGWEASGTGNMKFTLNGALTIGTLDGANVEICEEVGKENIFIFGMKANEVEALQSAGYDPLKLYNENEALRRVLDMMHDGFFNPDERDLFKPLVHDLLHRDRFCLLADFDSYVNCQNRVNELWLDQDAWTRMSMLNVARSGKFSSDRTIREYTEEIWKVPSVDIPHEPEPKAKKK
ncbi:MAG: glycogen/starch/alpha-glucan phosphorylase [Candidatus Cloacimonetes bacterium]|nr:glycogen/starch/alpha-glucan phosphorylase [Candidatus Cloacimonadota bacterium]